MVIVAVIVVIVIIAVVSKRAKLRLKSKSRWPTKRFRAIARSLSLSADPLIDLFDLTAGGGEEGYETTAGFTVERPYRLFIAADPEIPIDIGIENGTKASFGGSLQRGRRESWRRLNSWPRVIVEWILRHRRSSIDRFHSLLSISFFFFFFRSN